MTDKIYFIADRVYKDYYFNKITVGSQHYIHILKTDEIIGPCKDIRTISGIVVYYTIDDKDYCIDYKGEHINSIGRDKAITELIKYYYTELVDNSFLMYRADKENKDEYMEAHLLDNSVIGTRIIESNICGIDMFSVEIFIEGNDGTEDFIGGAYNKSNNTWLFKPSKQVIVFNYSNLSKSYSISYALKLEEGGK